MRNDDTEFINKLAFQGWSDEDYEYRGDLLNAIKPKLEDWFEEEVFNAYDYGHGLHAAHNLHRDLKHSEVANAIGIVVFNESFGYLWSEWEDSQDNLAGYFDWEGTCLAELDRLEMSIFHHILPWMTVSSLSNLLKALNKWELETKMNLKLNSLEKDFQ
jgi:hypothetical protein